MANHSSVPANAAAPAVDRRCENGYPATAAGRRAGHAAHGIKSTARLFIAFRDSAGELPCHVTQPVVRQWKLPGAERPAAMHSRPLRCSEGVAERTTAAGKALPPVLPRQRCGQRRLITAGQQRFTGVAFSGGESRFSAGCSCASSSPDASMASTTASRVDVRFSDSMLCLHSSPSPYEKFSAAGLPAAGTGWPTSPART